MFSVPGDFPNIIDVEFIPDSTVNITWSTVFFSNGEITGYIIHLIDSRRTITQRLSMNNITHTVNRYADVDYVDVIVRATNQYGDGPPSPVKRIYTNGMLIIWY